MASVNHTPNRQAFLDIVAKELPGAATITRKQVVDIVRVKHAGEIKWPSWLTGDKTLRAGRGEFIIPTLVPRTSKAGDTSDATSETVSTS